MECVACDKIGTPDDRNPWYKVYPVWSNSMGGELQTDCGEICPECWQNLLLWKGWTVIGKAMDEMAKEQPQEHWTDHWEREARGGGG